MVILIINTIPLLSPEAVLHTKTKNIEINIVPYHNNVFTHYLIPQHIDLDSFLSIISFECD